MRIDADLQWGEDDDNCSETFDFIAVTLAFFLFLKSSMNWLVDKRMMIDREIWMDVRKKDDMLSEPFLTQMNWYRGTITKVLKLFGPETGFDL